MKTPISQLFPWEGKGWSRCPVSQFLQSCPKNCLLACIWTGILELWYIRQNLDTWGEHRWWFRQVDAIGPQPLDQHRVNAQSDQHRETWPQLPASSWRGKEFGGSGQNLWLDWLVKILSCMRPGWLGEVPVLSNLQRSIQKVKKIEESGKNVPNKGTR